MGSSDTQLVIPALRGELAEVGSGHAQEYPSDHLRTPPAVIERVRQLGPIGLDPCSCRGSLVNARIEWHGPQYVLEDGLARSWQGHGLVYCFPPPRRIGEWAPKIASEARSGVEIVAMLSCRTDVAWLHDFVFPTAAAVCYWRGALQTLGEQRNSVPPRAIAYWGRRPRAFREVFATAGSVVLNGELAQPRSWQLVVPRPSPAGTWVKQQGKGSRAVKGFLERFATELDLANTATRCPAATGKRRVVIKRYGALKTGQQSLEQGGQLIVDLLCEKGLLSIQHGSDVQWRQTIDRRHPRTEIELSEV